MLPMRTRSTDQKTYPSFSIRVLIHNFGIAQHFINMQSVDRGVEQRSCLRAYELHNAHPGLPACLACPLYAHAYLLT